jgi:hypothetical protein
VYSIGNSLQRVGTSHIIRGIDSAPCAEAVARELRRQLSVTAIALIGDPTSTLGQ